MQEWHSEIIVDPYVQEIVGDLIIPSVNLASYGSGLNEGDIARICQDLNSSTCYLLQFTEGKQDLETSFDALEQHTKDHSVNMDEYVDNAISNLEDFIDCPAKYLNKNFH